MKITSGFQTPMATLVVDIIPIDCYLVILQNKNDFIKHAS